MNWRTDFENMPRTKDCWVCYSKKGCSWPLDYGIARAFTNNHIVGSTGQFLVDAAGRGSTRQLRAWAEIVPPEESK